MHPNSHSTRKIMCHMFPVMMMRQHLCLQKKVEGFHSAMVSYNSPTKNAHKNHTLPVSRKLQYETPLTHTATSSTPLLATSNFSKGTAAKLLNTSICGSIPTRSKISFSSSVTKETVQQPTCSTPISRAADFNNKQVHCCWLKTPPCRVQQGNRTPNKLLQFLQYGCRI